MSDLRRTRTRQFEPVNTANIENLDEYIEEMYSDSVDEKIKAIRNILYLTQEPSYLEYMINHGIS